jgi:tRNA pseudouridine55 synthase
MNGIFIIDKPEGWTSFDVIAKLRRLLGEKRIGHSGTLDPMATGVLPVFVGRATRAVEFMESADKEYLAGIRLGVSTDTQDTSGRIIKECHQDINKEELEAVLPRFRGEISQLPPMYSAIKVGGKKLYELARKGIELEREKRTVFIDKLEIVGSESGDFRLSVVCSKGTYIRTLCNDIGDALGCGGAMSTLRRTRAGAFTINDAVTIQAVEDAAAESKASELLRPIDNLFAEYPAMALNLAQEKICRNGGGFKVSGVAAGKYRAYGENEFLALAEVSENSEFATIKSFFEVK